MLPGKSLRCIVMILIERKDTEMLSPVDGYDLSSNGEKIIYKSDRTYGIIDAKPDEHKVGDGKLRYFEHEEVCEFPRRMD